MIALGAYAGLFTSALIAATLLPMQSEAVLVGLLIAEYSPALLLIVATAGNVLGSAINWLLGRQVERFQDRSWFPASPERLERASNWYRKYGRWSLLLSWAPVIGDPLTLVAGVLREPFWTFLLIVTIAKFGRYAVLTAVTLNLI
ncbi:YqaA family protein [Mesorhizobium sp. SB112]|uniref:YqaA family protein n=1 Tax=Mesorhizobium sp. SB112 TaxID=3151853 RepID=UPI003265FC14